MTLLVVLTGCDTIGGLVDSYEGDGASAPPIADSPGDEAAAATIDVSQPQVPPASTTYVETLCAVDPYETAGSEDPLAALAQAYRDVPTTSASPWVGASRTATASSPHAHETRTATVACTTIHTCRGSTGWPTT